MFLDFLNGILEFIIEIVDSTWKFIKILLKIGLICAGVLVLLIIIIAIFAPRYKTKTSTNIDSSNNFEINDIPSMTRREKRKLEKYRDINIIDYQDSLLGKTINTDKYYLLLVDSLLYKDKSYSQLCDYQAHAYSNGLFTLSGLYQKLIEERESYLIQQLLSVPIETSAEFYKHNSEKYPFLDSLFYDSVIPILDTCSYFSAKEINGLFEGTGIESYVQNRFLAKREIVLEIANSELSDIFTEEVSIVSAFQQEAAECITAYVDSSLTFIIERTLDRSKESIIKSMNRRISENHKKEKNERQGIFRSEEEAIIEMRNYVTQLCVDRFSTEIIADSLEKHINIFAASASGIRSKFSNYWIDGDSCETKSNMPSFNNECIKKETFNMNYEQVDKIIQEKFSSRRESFIWDLAGLIPILGDVLFVPDIIYNIDREKKEAEIRQKRILDFCSELRSTVLTQYLKYVDNTFYEYKNKALITSQEEFRRYVNSEI